jgi:hypothetical protein
MALALNSTEKDIFHELIKQAAEEMSNNSCNDYPFLVTENNQKALIGIINEIADDDYKDHLIGQAKVGNQVYFQDFLLMELLAKKIRTS